MIRWIDKAFFIREFCVYPLRGPESFKALHRAFLPAYPDLRVTIENTVSEGNKIAARCKVSARPSQIGEDLKKRFRENAVKI